MAWSSCTTPARFSPGSSAIRPRCRRLHVSYFPCSAGAPRPGPAVPRARKALTRQQDEWDVDPAHVYWNAHVDKVRCTPLQRKLFAVDTFRVRRACGACVDLSRNLQSAGGGELRVCACRRTFLLTTTPRCCT
jgi:hypothetical protein